MELKSLAGGEGTSRAKSGITNRLSAELLGADVMGVETLGAVDLFFRCRGMVEWNKVMLTEARSKIALSCMGGPNVMP